MRDAYFSECVGGIRLNGAYAARLNHNYFAIPATGYTDVSYYGNYGVGIYNCTGFEIENNELTITPQPAAPNFLQHWRCYQPVR
ncbi:MAG: hypothetical protein IPP33_11575 [Flavobacteriales bacterium]|nr:hypothetical protein [Flavobacteriales bacterium]